MNIYVYFAILLEMKGLMSRIKQCLNETNSQKRKKYLEKTLKDVCINNNNLKHRLDARHVRDKVRTCEMKWIFSIKKIRSNDLVGNNVVVDLTQPSHHNIVQINIRKFGRNLTIQCDQYAHTRINVYT